MEQAIARVLAIDDEKSVCVTCQRILGEAGYAVDTCLSGKEGVQRALQGDYEVVLLDLKLPDISGLEALEMLRRDRPDISVIIITGYASIQTSIQAIKKGAFDYVPKPFTPEELSLAVSKALENRKLLSENEFLKQELTRMMKDSRILGRSKAMEEILLQIRKVAPTDFTVTVYGESGTGKELIAQAIHDSSSRAEKPFVAVDLSALSAGLVESELFGHVRGAFTGATQSRPGYFSIAQGGTLFLDEISNISWELQGKLLRVLETRKVHPVGSEREIEVDVRIVTATNRDLFELVEAGKFREDLYYRLNVIPIVVPPLREHPDDIPLLATHFLEEARREAPRAPEGFTTEAMAKLISYHWPGNVRELKNIVERLVAVSDGPLIRPENLPPEIAGNTAAPTLALGDIPQNTEQLKEAKRRLKETLFAQVEKNFVQQALEHAGGNVTRAAQAVGMQRPNFHALMRRHGIRARERAGADEPDAE
ncbi:MAG: sigma-54-dependent Fis family transcriptional regulator [Myxococcales bacterium]|nr:sigma-54-dependent Fis family transcriptional regulator [Myxococcales bacterium]